MVIHNCLLVVMNEISLNNSGIIWKSDTSLTNSSSIQSKFNKFVIALSNESNEEKKKTIEMEFYGHQYKKKQQQQINRAIKNPIESVVVVYWWW